MRERRERDGDQVLWRTVDTKKKLYLCTLFTGSAHVDNITQKYFTCKAAKECNVDRDCVNGL